MEPRIERIEILELPDPPIRLEHGFLCAVLRIVGISGIMQRQIQYLGAARADERFKGFAIASPRSVNQLSHV